MKALSIKEPWLTLIADGTNGKHKSIETRTWKTNYRGPLLLVGSKKPGGYWYSGEMACVVDLIDCRPMTKKDEKEAMCDYHPSLFAWVFQDIQRVVSKPVTGQLGLYNVSDELIERKGSPIIIERG